MIQVTQEVIDEAIDRVSQGRALSEVCTDKDMPKYSVLMRAIRRTDANMQALDHAMECRAQLIFDAVTDEAKAEPDVQRAKLIFEVRKWSLGLMHHRFAERHRQEITGANGGAISIQRNMTEAEEEARIAELLAKGGYIKTETEG